MTAAPQPAAPQPAAPIGVFDSGVGGLTVLRALRSALPGDSFIYLGDTARLPYGTKSPQTVVRYSLQCAQGLISRGVRALVVACNTASASALPALRQAHPQYAHCRCDRSWRRASRALIGLGPHRCDRNTGHHRRRCL